MADERELGLQQRAKELLTKRLAETAEWGEAWTVEQYDLVFKAVEFASKSGVGDARDEVGALSLFNDLQEKVKAYEVAEGSRRAQEKFRRDQEECKAWVAKLAQFDKTVREAKMCVGELKKRSWDEATAEPDLNGPLMTPAVKNNASKALWLFPDKLHVAQRGLQALPENRKAMSAPALRTRMPPIVTAMLELAAVIDEVEAVVQAEVQRRVDIEARAVRALRDEALLQREAKAGRMLKQRKAANTLTSASDQYKVFHKQKQEQRKADHKEAAKAHAQRKKESVLAKARMEAELKMMREPTETAADRFADDLFGIPSPPQRIRYLTTAATEATEAEDDEAAAAAVEGPADEGGEEEEEEDDEEAAFSLGEVDEEARRAAAEALAKQRELEEERQQREAAVRKLREQEAAKAARVRAAEIAQELAALEEGSDDGEDEKEHRHSARVEIKKYQKNSAPNDSWDVWRAGRMGDLAMLKNFLLVRGTRLLDKHNLEDPTQGGRTLLHTAAYFGHEKMVAWLLLLGCNVDVLDTAHSRTTPLHEAARANRVGVCRVLLRHGASIQAQDSAGYTALHWAAKRGCGTLFHSLCDFAQKYCPGALADAFYTRTNAGKIPSNLAANGTVLAICDHMCVEIEAAMLPAALEAQSAMPSTGSVRAGAGMGGVALPNEPAVVEAGPRKSTSKSTRKISAAEAQRRRYGREREAVERKVIVHHIDVDGDGSIDQVVAQEVRTGFVTATAASSERAPAVSLAALGILDDEDHDSFFLR